MSRRQNKSMAKCEFQALRRRTTLQPVRHGSNTHGTGVPE
jgi:hypothetical protein